MKQLGFLESDSHSNFNRDKQPSQDDQAFFAKRATLLLGSYRKDNATNPETYIQAVTMVLSDFPQNVVELITDPRTGIQADQRYLSFAPNAGEVRAFCEEQMRRINRRTHDAPLHIQKRFYAPPESYPGCWARAWIHEGAPQFKRAAKLVENPTVDIREWRYEDRLDGRWLGISYRLHLIVRTGGVAA